MVGRKEKRDYVVVVETETDRFLKAGPLRPFQMYRFFCNLIQAVAVYIGTICLCLIWWHSEEVITPLLWHSLEAPYMLGL